MNHWLVKTELDKYSWSHFITQGRAVWDGVRSYQSRNNLRLMQPGDPVLFYHSVTKPAVGLATVVRNAYPDPTATDENGRPSVIWVVVDLEPVKPLVRPVPLGRLRAEPLLANMALLRQPRLSVSPVRPDEFDLILQMGR